MVIMVLFFPIHQPEDHKGVVRYHPKPWGDNHLLIEWWKICRDHGRVCHVIFLDMLPCSFCGCCRAAAQPTVGEPSCHPCHPRSTMRHPCACGLVAVAQLLASVAALDTLAVVTAGYTDFYCNKNFTHSGAYLVGVCYPHGLMITANDSHVTESWGPGCDGTGIRGKRSYELGACVWIGPIGKYSLERGVAVTAEYYFGGANCKGAPRGDQDVCWKMALRRSSTHGISAKCLYKPIT